MHSNQNELVHFGIKGMKWGVRKEKKPTGSRTKGRSKTSYSSTSKRGDINGVIRNADGKKVGKIRLQKDPFSKEMYIWNMSIDRNERNKSYGQQALKDAISKSRSEGCKKVYSETSSNNQAFLSAAKKAGFSIRKINSPYESNPYYRIEYNLDDVKHSDDYFEHFGIKGMKWGVRKAKEAVGRYRAKRESKYSEDYKRYKAAKRKKISELSDAELRALINRGNLEQQYRNLKKNDISMGRKFVQDVLYKSATATASGFVTKQMREGVDYVGAKAKSYQYLKSRGKV